MEKKRERLLTSLRLDGKRKKVSAYFVGSSTFEDSYKHEINLDSFQTHPAKGCQKEVVKAAGNQTTSNLDIRINMKDAKIEAKRGLFARKGKASSTET